MENIKNRQIRPFWITRNNADQDVNPKLLVLYGKQKRGKSTICSRLQPALYVDMKDETYHLNVENLALCEDPDSLDRLIQELIRIEKETGKHPFPYIVLDNASLMYRLMDPTAWKLYQKSGLANKTIHNLDMIPYGGGYYYRRDAFMYYIDTLQGLCDTLILIAHEKEGLNPQTGAEESLHIDLPKGLRDQLTGFADTIGHLSIDTEGKRCSLDFDNRGNVIAQSRIGRLSSKRIEISKRLEDGTVEVYWDRVLNGTQI